MLEEGGNFPERVVLSVSEFEVGTQEGVSRLKPAQLDHVVATVRDIAPPRPGASVRPVDQERAGTRPEDVPRVEISMEEPRSIGWHTVMPDVDGAFPQGGVASADGRGIERALGWVLGPDLNVPTTPGTNENRSAPSSGNCSRSRSQMARSSPRRSVTFALDCAQLLGCG